MCNSVVVLSVSHVDASEMASGSVVPPLHLIGAATADGARRPEVAQGDTGVDGVSTSGLTTAPFTVSRPAQKQ